METLLTDQMIEDISEGMFRVEPDGLHIRGEPTYDQWAAFGQRLFQMGNAVEWAQGDWLVYGEGQGDYGETYAQAIELTMKSQSTLANYAWVCKAYPPGERPYAGRLSLSHHKIAAKIKDIDLRNRLLEQAVDEDMSRDEFKALVDETLGDNGKAGNGAVEYCPPEVITAAVFDLMGEIMLDPFVSDRANERIEADEHFTHLDAARVADWHENVYLHCLTMKGPVEELVSRLHHQWHENNIHQAIVFLPLEAASYDWFSWLWHWPVCVTNGLLDCVTPDWEKSKTVRGYVIVYLGTTLSAFKENFGDFGPIVQLKA